MYISCIFVYYLGYKKLLNLSKMLLYYLNRTYLYLDGE